MAATVSAAPVESDLDRSGAEDEPRGTEPEEDGGNGQTGPTAGAQQNRLAKLPLSRIKTLMKADPDVSLASQESVFIIAKATVRHVHTHRHSSIFSQTVFMSVCLPACLSVYIAFSLSTEFNCKNVFSASPVGPVCHFCIGPANISLAFVLHMLASTVLVKSLKHYYF